MAEIKSPEKISELPMALIKNMITLATSGFGVVVALAWNDAIKQFVTDFIDPYLGKNSGIISMFIYASVVTFLAVVVTMQLTNIEKRIVKRAEKSDR